MVNEVDGGARKMAVSIQSVVDVEMGERGRGTDSPMALDACFEVVVGNWGDIGEMDGESGWEMSKTCKWKFQF